MRNTLKQHLNEAINFQEQVANYMINKGYYHPHDMAQQIQMDITAADTALHLANTQS